MVTMYSDGITIIVSLVDVPFYKNAGYIVVAEKPEEVEPVESNWVMGANVGCG